jgi:uncharacterized RDD family membrane protein YckC
MLEKNKISEEVNTLAGRGSRLGAVIIDSILIIPILIGIAIGTGFWDNFLYRGMHGIPLSLNEKLIIFLIGQSLFLILNGILLTNHGQTIGKRIMKVKIVDLDGQHVGILKLYSLRYLVFSLVSQIPVAGGLLSLVNVLFIFGKERKCLHDILAGTKVVAVS